MVSQPTLQSQWSNGIANPVTWGKGVLDGISSFDIEMAQLSQEGLTFIARNGKNFPLFAANLTRVHTVPATTTSLNVFLRDVPPGNDYFLMFMNYTHGVMYATSPRFTILASSSSAAAGQPTAIASAPTVTVSGAPNPTQPFATTFAAVENGVSMTMASPGQAWGLATVVASCLAGAVWTLS